MTNDRLRAMELVTTLKPLHHNPRINAQSMASPIMRLLTTDVTQRVYES